MSLNENQFGGVTDGQVRLYHSTESRNLPSIMRHGLRVSNALGSTYGEDNAIWASTRPSRDPVSSELEITVPVDQVDIGYESAAHKKFGTPSSYANSPEDIEAHVSSLTEGTHFVTLKGDVPPSAISHVRVL